MNGQNLKSPKLCDIFFDTGIYVIGRCLIRTKAFNYQIHKQTIGHHQDNL